MSTTSDFTTPDSADPTPRRVNRVILITADRTTYANIGYGTPRRAEVRVNGRSVMAAWTFQSIINAVDALGDETSAAETQASETPSSEPTSCIERKRAEMMAMAPGARDPREAWMALCAERGILVRTIRRLQPAPAGK
jgi:hypothetical protein